MVPVHTRTEQISFLCRRNTPVTHGQPTRQRATNATEINKKSKGVKPDPWQVIPRQVFTPYPRLLISNEFVVVSRVGCLGVTGVRKPQRGGVETVFCRRCAFAAVNRVHFVVHNCSYYVFWLGF